ncbi:MAG: hypothetical protein KF819_19730 [Labilithrix sp.]|nr:hypothetical protein [Labilithrix sp.]
MSTNKRRSTRGAAFRTAFAVTVASTAVLGLAATMSCADKPDVNRTTGVILPDFNTYVTHVDRYLARRCGSLDCHGQPGRAYRIYSREGFRLYTIADGSLVSGQQPTDPAEQRANFQALIGLEPEEMSRLMARQGDDIKRLLFIRKSLRIERHKGGPAMAEDDEGYRCVEAWLRIRVVDGEGNEIPADRRDKLTDRQAQNCAIAESFP